MLNGTVTLNYFLDLCLMLLYHNAIYSIYMLWYNTSVQFVSHVGFRHWYFNLNAVRERLGLNISLRKPRRDT